MMLTTPQQVLTMTKTHTKTKTKTEENFQEEESIHVKKAYLLCAAFLEQIPIFGANRQTDRETDRGVPRGPRGPKNKNKDKGKDEDKDKVLKRPIMCYILETQGAQRFQI